MKLGFDISLVARSAMKHKASTCVCSTCLRDLGCRAKYWCFFILFEVTLALTRRSTYGYVVPGDLAILLADCKIIMSGIGNTRLKNVS